MQRESKGASGGGGGSGCGDDVIVIMMMTMTVTTIIQARTVYSDLFSQIRAFSSEIFGQDLQNCHVVTPK